MRRAVFIIFLALGVGVGLLSALDGDWGLRIVMMAVGALFGGAVGGGLANLGRRRGLVPLQSEEEANLIPGMGTSGRDLAANYWRDKGRLPFTKMRNIQPDEHMFDPENIGR
ncbi:MAG: hypothetical protein RBS40_04860 [Rhodocyclaceae bacterium]|jgi:hypothetical protein|nr:hypothetical protein [Rhodocyclaceae bacterium]